ncbi:MAG: HAD-IA family hydrolase [Candidatus Saganbacteria bacterium]|nr:HAD-IA family hydrolase [Candidatus Saganbacteria bacterium]
MAAKKIDLIMLDFDGTIADSLPAAVKSIGQMLAELAYPPKNAEEIGRHIGFGERALVAGSIGSDDERLVAEAQAAYYRHNLENIKAVRPYPHVREFLELYQDKLKVVISNKRDEFIRLILAEHRLGNYFTEIIGGDSAACLKPDPCAINDVLKKYRVAAGRALYIGDMTVDVATGKNAGVLTCAVTYGFHGKAALAQAAPDLIVDDLLELKGLIA